MQRTRRARVSQWRRVSRTGAAKLLSRAVLGFGDTALLTSMERVVRGGQKRRVLLMPKFVWTRTVSTAFQTRCIYKEQDPRPASEPETSHTNKYCEENMVNPSPPGAELASPLLSN